MKYLSVIFLSVLLSACGVGPLKMDKQRLAGKTVDFQPATKADFKTFTLGSYTQAYFDLSSSTEGVPAERAKLGLTGDIKEIVQSYEPSQKIAAEVKRYFINDFKLRENNQSADYKITYAGTEWGLSPHPIAVTNYFIYYRPWLTITDLRPAAGKSPQSKSFWCNFKTDSKYSYDEIFANNASVIRQAMDGAVSECVRQFREDIAASAN